MPLNFSYITSHQPIYNGGIWIIDIHRSFQRLFSLFPYYIPYIRYIRVAIYEYETIYFERIDESLHGHISNERERDGS